MNTILVQHVISVILNNKQKWKVNQISHIKIIVMPKLDLNFNVLIYGCAINILQISTFSQFMIEALVLKFTVVKLPCMFFQ